MAPAKEEKKGPSQPGPTGPRVPSSPLPHRHDITGPSLDSSRSRSRPPSSTLRTVAVRSRVWLDPERSSKQRSRATVELVSSTHRETASKGFVKEEVNELGNHTARSVREHANEYHPPTRRRTTSPTTKLHRDTASKHERKAHGLSALKQLTLI